MNATGMPRNEGSIVQWGLARPWANHFKSRLLDIPYSAISIMN